MAELQNVKNLSDEHSSVSMFPASIGTKHNALPHTDTQSIVLQLEQPSEKISTNKSKQITQSKTKHSNNNFLKYRKKCCWILTYASTVIVILAILLAIPITMISIGSKYKNQCPINSKIPTFLIVAGVFSILNNIWTFSKTGFDGEGPHSSQSVRHILCCLIRIQLFLFIWIILGSVWTFNVKSIVQYEDSIDLNTYCHKTLYLFTFVILIVNYFLLSLSCCFSVKGWLLSILILVFS